MQTRLLSCLAGAFIGAVFTSRVNESFDLGLIVASIACVAAGGTAGYLTSYLFDIFTAGNQT